MMDGIPFKCVPYCTWTKLANKMDPEMVVGNNWRILADKLGYSTDEILVLESKQSSHGSNTIKLFEEYVNKSGSTVDKMQEALEQMERPDALNILLDALPDIQKNHEARHEINRTLRKKQQRLNQAVENDLSMPSYSTVHRRDTLEHSNLHCYPSRRKPTHHAVNQHCQRNRSPHVITSSDLPNLNHRMPRESPPSHSMIANVADSLDYYPMNEDEDNGMEYISSHQDNPLPLPLGIFRGEHCLDSIQHAHFSNTVEVSTTPSPEDKSYPVYVKSEVNRRSPQQLVAHHMLSYHRQTSDERNLKQHLHDPKTAIGHSKLRLNKDNVSSSISKKACRDKNDFNSPSLATPINVSHLDKLEQLATLRRFKPDEDFTDMMKEKREEELLQQKMPVKAEICYNSCRYNKNSDQFFTNTHQRCKEESKCLAPKETSKTFPMRIRSATSDRSPKESSKQVGLVKSVSMPNDMKPAEYHKAFRQIKVFVTYAADTHRHIQCVLNLCNCLEKNGFTCCMDIYHRRLQMEDRHGWFDNKFKEADFILVCVSDKYKSEVEQNAVFGESSVNGNCLHTKYIYGLMHSEFVRNNSTNTRFIPLLFDTASQNDVPSWLQNTLLYKWPQDWKDLMWMLTKPEERIKPRPKSYFRNSNQSKPCGGK